MSNCRFCLAQKPRKHITELNCTNENESYKDIILYCLGIQVDEDSKISTKLCVKCFRSTLEFHQFKTKALKSEEQLKTHINNPNIAIDNTKSDVPKEQIKTEVETVDINYDDGIENNDGIEKNDGIENNDDFGLDVKFVETEVEIKNELKAEDGSDDEFLSVMKKIKYEFIEEKDENYEPTQKKKGRPKKLKRIRIKMPKSKQDYKVGPMKICETCGKYVRDLTAHKQTHIPIDARPKFKCDICDKLFSSAQSKYKHRSRKHFAKKKECPVCHKMVLNLSMHEKRHNPEDMKYECAPCGRRFVSKSQLDLHVSIHTKDRPHECHICQKKFRLKLCMQLHVRQVHEKEKSHLCQYCSKSFFKKHHLQLHLRSHTKEKPCECTVCGKFFSSTTVLKNHMLIHSDDKKFACSLCDMTFVRVGYLNAHMLSHTKEKRFPCQYCGVRFHRSDHRKRHEFTAHVKHNAAPTPT